MSEDLYIGAAKRLGVQQSEWLDDWYISHSPRNGNMSAEGLWCHWVQLARLILAHPLTAERMPDFHMPYEAEHVYDDHHSACTKKDEDE